MQSYVHREDTQTLAIERTVIFGSCSHERTNKCNDVVASIFFLREKLKQWKAICQFIRILLLRLPTEVLKMNAKAIGTSKITSANCKVLSWNAFLKNRLLMCLLYVVQQVNKKQTNSLQVVILIVENK